MNFAYKSWVEHFFCHSSPPPNKKKMKLNCTPYLQFVGHHFLFFPYIVNFVMLDTSKIFMLGDFSLICHVWCAQHVNRLEITPDKHYLAAAGNPHIRLFDVNSNSPQPVRCSLNWSYFYLSKEKQNSFCTFLNSLLCIFFHSLMWTRLWWHGRWWAMIHILTMWWQWGFNVMETGCIQVLRMAQ